MGRSLAMNSAKRLRTKRTRKIQNDQYPRRLARKFASRRRLSGESRMKPSCGSGGATGDAAGEAGGAEALLEGGGGGGGRSRGVRAEGRGRCSWRGGLHLSQGERSRGAGRRLRARGMPPPERTG